MKKIFYITSLTLAAIGIFVWSHSASALTVGPVKLEFVVNPGDTVSGSVLLQNEESNAKTFYPSYEAFTEEDGQKVFSQEESDLASWIQSASSVTLTSQEETRVPFTINIPKDAAPGSHFAVMWWGNAPANMQGSQQVSIVTKAGILIYLTVRGDLHEIGSVAQFNAGGSSLYWDMPVPLTLKFQNSGNVYLKPKGSIVINSLWGTRKKILVFNEYGSQVLPGKEKTFQFALAQDDGFFFGPYRAVLDMTYGSDKTKISQSFWFWIFPIGWVIKFVLILLLIFFVLPILVRYYNRWIIRKAQRSRTAVIR